MSKSHTVYRCDACNRTWSGFEAEHSGEPDVPLCPVCHGVLRINVALPESPVPFDFGLRMLGAFARLILNARITDIARRKAAETDTPLDDAALRVADALLQQLAKL